MATLGLFLLCIPTVAAAVWAHYRLSLHPAGVRWKTVIVLITIGIGFGLAMGRAYAGQGGLAQVLVFISSFGLVHVPAAFILQMKHIRGLDHSEN
jgi:multisubunit Na+/H+ antiporter MnhB subunit